MNNHHLLTEALVKARTDLAQKTVLERRHANTVSALKTAKDKVQALERAYQKEARDVEKMNSLSFSNFVATLLNSKAERLEKEELEALEAKRLLDSAQFDVMALESEAQSLSHELGTLAHAQAQYETALKVKRDYLFEHMAPTTNQLESLEVDLQSLVQQGIEISEALDASRSTYQHLETVVGILSEAKSWSTYDIVGGGMFATMVKRDKMDQAKQQMDGLNLKIQRLNRELADIATLNVAHMDLEGLRISDYLFDCFFVDLAVHQRITDALDALKGLGQKLDRLTSQLEFNLETSREALHAKQRVYQDSLEQM